MYRSLIAGLGQGVAAWLQRPTAANLYLIIDDKTGTGSLVFGTSPGFTTSANPITNDGATLGTASLQWSDLFLAEGGVINWDNGDATLTQSGNMVTLAGADLTAPNLIATTNITAGTAFLPDANDGAALGTTALQFSDLFLAEGGVINWDNGDATITQTGNTLAFAGASDGYTFDALLNISSAAAGQIQFPASQNASADANTLDDYEEGTWTPVLTFATPGNLSVTYSAQVGSYTKIGRQVTVQYTIVTSAFTHTTASGTVRITGLPFTSADVAFQFNYGALSWAGITKAGYTDAYNIVTANSSIILIQMSGNGLGVGTVAVGDMPTGGTVVLAGTLAFTT